MEATPSCSWHSCSSSCCCCNTACMHADGPLPPSAAADARKQQDSPDTAVVSVSVGGQLFTTTLGTLTAVPGSYLAMLFDSRGSWAPSLYVQGTNIPFIDRSPACFTHVLEYLRCLRYHGSQPSLPGSSSGGTCSLQQLRAEAEFYMLPGLARMCQLGPRFYTAGLCSPEQQQQQPQEPATAAATGAAVHTCGTSSGSRAGRMEQQQQESSLWRGLSQQDSGLEGAAAAAAAVAAAAGASQSPVPLSENEVQLSLQQQQDLPLLEPQQLPGPSLLAQAVSAAQELRAAQQAAWRCDAQLQQLADLVLRHLLHLPLAAAQPDLVALLANPGSGNRLELLLQYYPVGDLRIELECRTVPAGAPAAAATAVAAGAAAAGLGVGVGIAGSSPSMLSPRDGWVQQQQSQSQQQQQQGAYQNGQSSAAAAGFSRPLTPAAGARVSADGGSVGGSSGSTALPGPGVGGVTSYHTFRIRETLDDYVCSTIMPGDGQQLQELPRARHKPEVLRYSTLNKLLVQQAPRRSVAGLLYLLQEAGFAGVQLSTVLDTYHVAGNAFPGIKSVLTFDI